MTTKNVYRGLVVTLLLLVAGCSPGDRAVSAYQSKLEQYEQTESLDALEQVTSEYADIGYWDIFEKDVFETAQNQWSRIRRWKALSARTEVLLIENEEWDHLAFLYRNGMQHTEKARAMLYSRYTGSNVVLLEHKARAAHQQGDLYQAYKAFEKAALIDTDTANLVRGFTRHYGCTDLYDIWGELEDSRAFFEGAPIPLSERSLSHQELVEARANVRKGVSPEIPANCPLTPEA